MGERTRHKITGAYEARKAYARKREREEVRAGQDIGELPAVAKPRRRAEGRRSFRRFCEIYFPERFRLGWSKDHLVAIERIELATLRGGQFAMAMPRGYGKTSLLETACEWAICYGIHMMVALLAANKARSLEILDGIKTDLETNELLLADFPEICVPVRALEGIANRCAGQTYRGVRTRVVWRKDCIMLPNVPGQPSAGAVLKCSGLTGGGIRGMKHDRPDGRTARPGLVFVDDPQTDSTARSPTQNESRERLLSGAVLGMAGPDRRIAAMMALTVIEPGDLADRMLNAETHPDWQPLRTKLLYRFPADEKLWAQYGELRAEGLRARDEGKGAGDFYRQHRTAMDQGAEPAWSACYDEHEISAIQHAMNLRLRNEQVFFAEYQNDPAGGRPEAEWLTAERIADKVNGFMRGQIPVAAVDVTGYVDVHDRLLFWMVCAWQRNFTGYVIDYGTWPQQDQRYFSLRGAGRPIRAEAPGVGEDAGIRRGLDALVGSMLRWVWQRDDRVRLQLSRLMIDENFKTVVVHEFIRQHPAGFVFPANGLGLGASSPPWDSRPNKPGEKGGDHWRITPTPNRTAKGQHINYDTNHWKTYIQRALARPIGEAGNLTLYAPERPGWHQLLGEHLAAEVGHEVVDVRYNRRVVEWKLPPAKPDNHWLDCVVGCAVLASMAGATTATPAAMPRPAVQGRVRKPVKATYF